MTLAKIALLGSAPFFEGMLPEILRETGYEVDLFDETTIDEQGISRFDAYNVLILSADLATQLEEKEFFSCILSTKGFLIAKTDDHPQVSFQGGTEHISHTMSPEEIIFRVNNIVFRSHQVRKSPRVRVQFEVEYESQGICYKSHITTISLYGIFISSLNPLQNNSQLGLSFSLPGEGKRVEASGRVLYSIGYNLVKGIISHPEKKGKKIIALPGMGVFFEEISEADQESIRSFIESRSRE